MNALDVGPSSALLPITFTPAPAHGEIEQAAWFVVRCVFACGSSTVPGSPVCAERLTFWRAASAEEAVARAEAEAKTYAASVEEPDVCLRQAQAHRLVSEPGDGAELFSSLRDGARPHLAVGVSGADVRTSRSGER